MLRGYVNLHSSYLELSVAWNSLGTGVYIKSCPSSSKPQNENFFMFDLSSKIV